MKQSHNDLQDLPSLEELLPPLADALKDLFPPICEIEGLPSLEELLTTLTETTNGGNTNV